MIAPVITDPTPWEGISEDDRRELENMAHCFGGSADFARLCFRLGMAAGANRMAEAILSDKPPLAVPR